MLDYTNMSNNSRIDEKELIKECGGSLFEKLKSFKRKQMYILYFIILERCVGSLFEAGNQIVLFRNRKIVGM